MKSILSLHAHMHENFMCSYQMDHRKMDPNVRECLLSLIRGTPIVFPRKFDPNIRRCIEDVARGVTPVFPRKMDPTVRDILERFVIPSPDPPVTPPSEPTPSLDTPPSSHTVIHVTSSPDTTEEPPTPEVIPDVTPSPDTPPEVIPSNEPVIPPSPQPDTPDVTPSEPDTTTDPPPSPEPEVIPDVTSSPDTPPVTFVQAATVAKVVSRWGKRG